MVAKHNFMLRSIWIGTLSCRNIQLLRFENVIFCLLTRYLYLKSFNLPLKKWLPLVHCNQLHANALQMLLPFDVLRLYVHPFLNCDNNTNIHKDRPNSICFHPKKVHFFARLILFFAKLNLTFSLRSFNGSFYNTVELPYNGHCRDCK